MMMMMLFLLLPGVRAVDKHCLPPVMQYKPAPIHSSPSIKHPLNQSHSLGR